MAQPMTGYCSPHAYSIEHKYNLLPLRQLTEGYLCYDTLFLLPRAGVHDELVQLASTWQADELSWWSFDFVASAAARPGSVHRPREMRFIRPRIAMMEPLWG